MKNKIKNLLLLGFALILAACSGSVKKSAPTTPAAKSAAPKFPSHARRIQPELLPLPIPETGRRTVQDVLYGFGPYAVEQLQPYFRKAGVSYPPREVTLIALKQEKKLELWARDSGEYRFIRDYPIRAASGFAGPKLRQGDRQVPEGIYRIVGLNPNSNYHLSMRLNYPNEFDLFHAHQEGRGNPGSDIFIHGKDVSAGCLAMGDAVIEELFVLSAHTGTENIRVVIAPHDPRIRPLNPNGAGLPPWAPELYREIGEAMRPFSDALKVSSRKPSYRENRPAQ